MLLAVLVFLGSNVFAPTEVGSKSDIVLSDVFVPTGFEYKGGQLTQMFWRSNSLLFFPNFKLSFIVIVVVTLCLTRSNLCIFAKILIRRAPMGTIRRPSDFGNKGTDTTSFIQWINDREPQINELWCLSVDKIYHKVHPEARLEIPAGTVRELVTDYLAENGRHIPIIGKLSVDNSVQFLGLSDQAWGSGLPYIYNLVDQVEATGSDSSNNSNQNWGISFNNANIITNITWGASVSASCTNLPRSLGCPWAARRRICNNFLCCRRQEHLWRHCNHRNPLVNPWACRQGEYRDGPVTKHFLFKFPLLVWVTFSRLHVRSPCASLTVAVFDS